MDKFSAPKKVLGSKPLFLFVGSQWDTDSLFTRIQSLLLDMFRGVKLDKISLQGIDHVVMCSIVDSKIMLRVYSVSFMKSGTRVRRMIIIFNNYKLQFARCPMYV
jgi:hypothetical protein